MPDGGWRTVGVRRVGQPRIAHQRFGPRRLMESDARSPELGSPGLRLFMLVALYSVPVVVTLRPIGEPVFDPDIWWHLRTGQWVLEHRDVPHLDPFSQIQKPWVAYSWLYEAGLYQLYEA